MKKTVKDVHTFWENNPLWSGESQYAIGTKDFFDEHYHVYVDDCFAGSLDEKCFPADEQKSSVLDLGCGIGFWTIELLKRDCHVTAADLTSQALVQAQKRCALYGFGNVDFSQQNAESLTFENNFFFFM